MASVKVQATQTAINGTVVATIPTGLTIDGRTGWKISGGRWQYVSVNNAWDGIADAAINYQLTTEGQQLDFLDPDIILQGGIEFSGGTASSGVQLVTTGVDVLPEGRVTVQPSLDLVLFTTGMVSTLIMGFELFYEPVRLTDLEVMRLMQGGA